MTHASSWTRRSALKGLALSGLPASLAAAAQAAIPQAAVPQAAAPQAAVSRSREEQAGAVATWAPGWLEIHHISTGRGNVAFLVCPDGTTLLIDAGALHSSPDWGSDERFRIQPKPDASRRPGQWIARYIARHMPAGRTPEIDCFILTHLHPDHMGGLNLLPHEKELSRFGPYELTGVMDVHEAVPIRRIFDRAYPTYEYPAPLDDPHQRNYRAFLASFTKYGGVVERFIPGSATQIGLQHQAASHYPDFHVRNLCANGRVWTGRGDAAQDTFPPLSTLSPADHPNENKCSLALRLTYGRFSYFSGGDLEHETDFGRLPWGDIETKAAQASGPVDVALMDHHGYVNACGPEWVRALRPQAFVLSAWDSAHPTIPSLANMLSRELYPEPRDIFSTALKYENIIATKQLHQIASGEGHIVVRVPPATNQFHISITTNHDESYRKLWPLLHSRLSFIGGDALSAPLCTA